MEDEERKDSGEVLAETCSEPDCPGCIAERFIRDMTEVGCDPEMITEIFCLALQDAFEGIRVEEVTHEVVEGTIH